MPERKQLWNLGDQNIKVCLKGYRLNKVLFKSVFHHYVTPHLNL